MPGNPEDDKNYNQQEVGMMSSKPVAFEYMKQLEWISCSSKTEAVPTVPPSKLVNVRQYGHFFCINHQEDTTLRPYQDKMVAEDEWMSFTQC